MFLWIENRRLEIEDQRLKIKYNFYDVMDFNNVLYKIGLE